MNTRNRRISLQLVNAPETAETETPSSFVRDFDFGEIHKATFSITVKSDEKDEATGKEKILYSNKAEAFEYEKVTGFAYLLKHAGAKLDDSSMNLLAQALVTRDAQVNET